MLELVMIYLKWDLVDLSDAPGIALAPIALYLVERIDSAQEAKHDTPL